MFIDTRNVDLDPIGAIVVSNVSHTDSYPTSNAAHWDTDCRWGYHSLGSHYLFPV
jgi:hypothetical protein